MARSITRQVLLVAVIYGATSGVHAAVWRDAPEYAALFVPAVHKQFFRAAVSASGLESVLAELAGDPALAHAPGAWQAHTESPQDAFGTAGPYNRWLLARAYGSRQVRVARGARTERGRVVEAWTLLSPYPSTDLRTLQPGTLRLVLEIAP